MVTINGRRCVCLATSNQSVRRMLTFLWENGVESDSTTSISECIQLISLKKPDFVLLAYDHPEYSKVVSLTRAINKKVNATVIAFVERQSPAILIRLSQAEAEYQLWPPVDGRSALQVLNKILKQHPERFYQQAEPLEAENKMVREAHERSLGFRDMSTAVGDAVQYSIDQICKVHKSIEFYQTISEVKNLIVIPIHSEEMAGYLVAVAGELENEKQEKLKLLREILEFSKYWMKRQGVVLDFMNEVLVSVPETEFQSWAANQGEFYKTGYHKNYELSIAYFSDDSPVPNLELLEDGHVRALASDFSAGQRLDMDVKIWMPEQQEYQVVAGKESYMRGHQIDVVRNSKDPHFYIAKPDSHLLYENYVQTNLNHMIEDFSFSFIEQDLQDKLLQKKDQERIRTEIDSARGVQDYLFPKSHHIDEDFELRGFTKRASETGGDWWHYNIVGRKAYFWIGDATGHGLPAAMVTAAAKSASAIVSDLPELPLEKMMGLLNRAVYAAGGGEVLMTFVLACLDLDTGKLSYCNASHDFPVVLPSVSDALAKRDIVLLDGKTGPRLGEMVSPVYTVSQTNLQPGGRLVFFTDGIKELQDSSGKQWGERRFLQTILKAFNQNTGITAPMQMIQKAAQDFRRGTPYADDVTYFMVLFKPSARKIKRAS
jgi:serine phosphatase RsbU (regulator of sigma subunit)